MEVELELEQGLGPAWGILLPYISLSKGVYVCGFGWGALCVYVRWCVCDGGYLHTSEHNLVSPVEIDDWEAPGSVIGV